MPSTKIDDLLIQFQCSFLLTCSNYQETVNWWEGIHYTLESTNERILICTAKASPAYITLICEVSGRVFSINMQPTGTVLKLDNETICLEDFGNLNTSTNTQKKLLDHVFFNRNSKFQFQKLEMAVFCFCKRF